MFDEYDILETANDRRHRDSASQAVALLTAYLDRGNTAGATDGMLAAGRARIAYPDDSLVQLAQRLGQSKDTVAGRLRRLKDLATGFNRRTREGL